MIIGVIGNGFVGKATCQLNCPDIQVLAYDINPEACVPPGLQLADLNKCELIFISVPTPMSKDGSCHLNIIESVLQDLQKINYSGFLVLRSTVPVGTSDHLQIHFMPEFLTEKNFIQDFIENKDWIFGLSGNSKDLLFQDKIEHLFELAHHHNRIQHNSLHFIPNKEAEMVKMFKNCFLAAKVSFCNEVYQFCQTKDINYEQVRQLSCLDERITDSHTQVPGHDGKLGFGGTCFPKDTSSLRYEMVQHGVQPHILNAVIHRNENVDRPEKDWKQDIGRAVVVDKEPSEEFYFY